MFAPPEADLPPPNNQEPEAGAAPAAAAPAPEPKSNKLNWMQSSDLANWIKERAERCRLEPDQALAAEAADALGFLVTRSNLASIRHDLGIEKAKPAPPAPQPDLFERLQLLESQHQQILSRLAALETTTPTA